MPGGCGEKILRRLRLLRMTEGGVRVTEERFRVTEERFRVTEGEQV